jgi:hypothetical protein
MAAHPDVIMSRPKETGFFQGNYSRGTDWLESHFSHYEGETAVGEGSVHTMYCPDSPRRIDETIPGAKLLFLLRNPIERLYSHYYYDLRCGHLEPTTSFQDVIYQKKTPRHERMVRMGFYDNHLSRFDEQFGNQMLVLLSDDLRRETSETVKQALSFVGVDPSDASNDLEPKNETQHIRYRRVYAALRATWTPVQSLAESAFPKGVDYLRSLARALLSQKERPPMPREDRQYLRDMYAESIQKIEDRLGRNLSHWS